MIYPDDKWIEDFKNKQGSIHIKGDLLIFESEHGIAMSKHKTFIDLSDHIVALRTFLIVAAMEDKYGTDQGTT